MPHDRDGKVVRVGDVVDVPCHVKEVHDTEDYCNVTLETSQPMYPGNKRSTFVLNAKQVVKCAIPMPPAPGEGIQKG